ncbi:response regulator [Candidatus Saccharibacteria bacterium]|nr:MAG: response regulator [Candidatus Saccharibacteria bacterium]
MTKIMLVEDDKSLREIYGVRLLAEGYDIVSAGDGEEALAMAIKERPQLIVSDVMMPKISGFDMLDILRSTTETKDIKVIMMTALSSEEQRSRGESLGADRYLVKSQVGIEDVVHVVHEVLGDQATVPAVTANPVSTPSVAPTPAAPSVAAPASTPAAPTAPIVPPQPAATLPTSATAATPAQPLAPPPSATMPTPMKPAPPVTAATPAQPLAPPSTAPKPPSQRARIIQPLNDPTQPTVDLNQLLDQELAKEASSAADVTAPVSTDEEKALINEQIASFTPPTVAATPATAQEAAEQAQTDSTDVPEINISEDGSVTPEEAETAPASVPAAPTPGPTPATAASTPPPPPPSVTPPAS